VRTTPRRALAFAAALLAAPALAQGQANSQVLTVRIYPDADRFVAGKPFRIAFVADIGPGWHVNSHTPKEDYLIPTALTFEPVPGVQLGEPLYPKQVEKKLEFSDKPVALYEGKTVIFVSGTVADSASAGLRTFVGTLAFQACNDKQCLPPAKAQTKFEIPVGVKGVQVRPMNQDIFKGPGAGSAPKPGSPKADAGPGAGPPETTASLREKWSVKGVPTLLFLGPDGTERAERILGYEPPARFLERLSGAAATATGGLAGKSLPILLGVVFLAGLALNLTPCVYPLIPITVSFFSRQAPAGGKGKTFSLALVYVLGMSVTYSALGVFAALSGSLFGAWLQKPAVLVAIAAVVVALALSMFGLYEIQAPHALTDRTGSRSGALGALTMGLFVGFVAAPCIGPFVLSLLTFVAQAGSPALGFGLFFTLAMGLGVPYLVLGTASASLRSLPRSGEWMVAVRKFFGFALLALAVYFLRSLLPERVYELAVAAPLVLGGLYILLFEKNGRSLVWFRAVKVAVALTFFAAGAVFAFPAKHDKELAFRPYSEAALEEARAAKKPVMIDFYATWCLPCKELDEKTFRDPRVVDALKDWVLLKADLTRE
jgi:thiol:disulfide interchange protein DsbD